jgi:hypothetical protein
MSTPVSGRRRARNNNMNEPPPLRRRTAHGRVNIRRNNLINQYGSFLPQRLNYGNEINNWQKQGAPRNIRVLPYTARRNLMNEISLNNFKHGNVAYLMFRRGVPVMYTAGSLYGMIKSGPYGRYINSVNNLNSFLARVKNNGVLFRNAQTRQNRTQKNIRKVKLSMNRPARVMSMNRAARVIQRKFRSKR